VGKVEISFEEKRIFHHLRLGGPIQDEVGRRLVQKFIRRVWAQTEIHRIATMHGFSSTDLEAIYAGTIEALMPAPWMNFDGPRLVPTVFFLEPFRLLRLLIETIVDGRGLTGNDRLRFTIERAAETGRLLRDRYDSANGPPNLQLVSLDGVQWSDGCLGSVVIVSLLLGSLFLLLR
jgi:hypothetical protein